MGFTLEAVAFHHQGVRGEAQVMPSCAALLCCTVPREIETGQVHAVRPRGPALRHRVGMHSPPPDKGTSMTDRELGFCYIMWVSGSDAKGMSSARVALQVCSCNITLVLIGNV